MRVAPYMWGVAVLAASIQVVVSASTVPTAVPEIDGGWVMSGLGLLTGGVMVLRARYGGR